MIELQGTEKQIAFAEVLRQEKVSKLQAAIVKAESLTEKHSTALEDGDLQAMIELQSGSLSSALRVGGVNKSIPSATCVAVLKNTVKWVSKQQSAKWWIDNGNFTADYLVSEYCKKFVKVAA